MSAEYDYFDMFDLSRQDTWQVNYKKLQELLYKENQRHGRQSETRQSLLKQAVSSFKNETEYQNYLKKLDAGNGSTNAPEPEEPKQQAPETQQQAASPLKTDWHKLGDALKGHLNLPEDGVRATALDLLANRLSNKQIQASQPSVNQQAAINHVSLHGIWREPEGYVWTFEQQGNQLSVQAKSPYPLMATVIRASLAGTLMATVIGISMTGTVSGRQVQLSGFVDSPGSRVHARATFTLSTDELRLEGAFFGNGKTVPLTLYR